MAADPGTVYVYIYIPQNVTITFNQNPTEYYPSYYDSNNGFWCYSFDEASIVYPFIIYAPGYRPYSIPAETYFGGGSYSALMQPLSSNLYCYTDENASLQHVYTDDSTLFAGQNLYSDTNLNLQKAVGTITDGSFSAVTAVLYNFKLESPITGMTVDGHTYVGTDLSINLASGAHSFAFTIPQAYQTASVVFGTTNSNQPFSATFTGTVAVNGRSLTWTLTPYASDVSQYCGFLMKISTNN